MVRLMWVYGCTRDHEKSQQQQAFHQALVSCCMPSAAPNYLLKGLKTLPKLFPVRVLAVRGAVDIDYGGTFKRYY